MLKANMTPDDM